LIKRKDFDLVAERSLSRDPKTLYTSRNWMPLSWSHGNERHCSSSNRIIWEAKKTMLLFKKHAARIYTPQRSTPSGSKKSGSSDEAIVGYSGSHFLTCS
jgi:hypothetical protein